jgi:MoaA/NifB/PqqE/SkfB family radical SAM enzyme
MDLMNGYIQHPPFFIEIEPTEGCNLGCSFCGLRGIRKNGTKPWKFLSLENAKTIAQKIADENWTCPITFCGHGEPTLNKNLIEIMKIFRNKLPKNRFNIITNGAGFRNGIFEINDFLDKEESIGLNDLIFDVYSNNGDWTVVSDIKRKTNIKIIGQDNEGFTYRQKELRIALYPMDIKGNKAILRSLSNHCGAASPLDYRRKDITCVKPFREFFIRWDGSVALCCDDFRGQYFIENVLNKITLKEIWNHERFQAARIMLFNKSRTISPCLGCSCPPIRAGLIPDPSGKDKDKMPKITKDVIRIFKSAYNPKGLTTIVKRDWE